MSELVQKALKHFDTNSLWYDNIERFVLIEKFESLLKIGVTSEINGDIEYIRFINKDGEPHRNNENPSFISENGVMWHKNGKLHRKNGKPAIIRKLTNEKMYNVINFQNIEDNEVLGNNFEGWPKEEYFINGVRHRDFDLPAVNFGGKNEHKYWFKDGVMHRDTNKPSIINGNFHFYFKNGKLYKTKINYENKIINWIMNNPFILSAIIFILFVFVLIIVS